MPEQQGGVNSKRPRGGGRGAIICECARGKMGVVGCIRGAGRCAHQFMLVAGARAGGALHIRLRLR